MKEHETAPHSLSEPDAGSENAAASRLDPHAVFRGARLIILGGTGFLGKLFWIMLLERFPEIAQIDLLVRSGKGKTSEQRFWAEVATSEALEPLRKQHGDGFEAFLRSKIVPFDGDVGRPLCGVSPENISKFHGASAVVNVAGVVDFNPPLDEALDTNAFGTTNLIEFCRALGDVPLYHTSTCYVVGNRTGLVEEVLPSSFPFPRAKELGRELWDPEREIADCLSIIASARARAEDGFRQSEFLEAAKKNLEKRGEPPGGRALDREFAKVKRKFVETLLVDAGKERATHWGWPNIYTYTKSIGEQIIEKSGLRFTLARPACCESTREFPFPAWNEGLGTSAPIIYLCMKGQHQIPGGDTVLDFIPSDIVCVGMVLALAELLEGTQKPVYQFGASDVNPVTSGRINELNGLYKRKYYQRTNKGGPIVSLLQQYMEPAAISMERFDSVGPGFFAAVAKGAAKALKAAPGPAAAPARSAAKSLEKLAAQEERIDMIVRLFAPFTSQQKGPFSCANTRAAFERLSPEDRKVLPWNPETIDWHDYWLNQHMPAMEHRVIPWLDERWRRDPKPQEAHETLATLVTQMAERHGYKAAFSKLEETGLAKVGYAEVLERAHAAAARLAQAGVAKGDRVVLTGRNDPAWPIAFFGIMLAGAVAVPLDANLEPASFVNVVGRSEAKMVLWDEHVETRVEDGYDGYEAWKASKTFLYLADVTNNEVAVPFDFVPPTVHEDDVASLIFTSGTTGIPKGVQLTHRNFTALVASLAVLFPLTPRDRVLSVLPLHHTFEFSCGFLLPFCRGAETVYLGELTSETVNRGLREAHATAMVGVPAVWQLLERKILGEIEARGPIASAVFDGATFFNRRLSREVGIDLGKVLFSPVHDALGGRMRFLISGGAALPKETHALFQGLGFKLTEGYGLTEAAPVVAVAKAGSKAGQVGKPIPGAEIRIANPDISGIGDVEVKSPSVMKGYTDEAATREVLTADGWLKTGDRGSIDRKGNLILAGRSKEVVVAANGENVYPDDVENLLGTIPFVAEYSVLGITSPSGGERIALLAVAEEDENLSREARRARAEKEIHAAVGKLPWGKQPSVVQLYDAPLPRTATRKVKRSEARAILERIVAAQRPADGATRTTFVRHAIATVKGLAPETIHGTSTLQGDLGLDSLALSELLVALEARVGNVDPEKLQACATVADVEALVDVAAPLSMRPAAVHRGKGRWAIIGRDATTSESNDSKPSETLELPPVLQDAGRKAIGKLQDLFYGKMMKSDVTGRAFLPKNHNVLVVANHASHLDMGFVRHALGSYGEDLVSLAASDYFFEGNGVKKAFFENFTNLEPIDRKSGLRASERKAAEVLSRGSNVLIFPEGTRSTDGTVQEFKALVGHLALTYEKDILPVWLGGTHSAMPKGSSLPKGRAIKARIGLPFTVAQMRRLTVGLTSADASREVARLARKAITELEAGRVLDFAALEPADRTKPAVVEEHPLVRLFADLEKKFDAKAVKKPLSFYFTLGNDNFAKWTVIVGNDGCAVRCGKPDSGTADCVLKTSPELFSKIVRDAWTPGAAEFLSGAVKSNDVGLLLEFQQIFQLGQ
jgi:long-chain acyl-CoA synthetase